MSSQPSVTTLGELLKEVSVAQSPLSALRALLDTKPLLSAPLDLAQNALI